MNINDTMSELGHSLQKSGGKDLLRRLERVSPDTARHSREVSRLAIRLGWLLPEVEAPIIVQLGFSGVLHDIGKSHPSILELVNSPQRFTPQERAKVRQVHTQEGGSMLASLMKSRTGYKDLLGTAAYVALHHHDDPQTRPEKVNASPVRPMVTGLIQVIDTFEAMQGQGRPYLADPAGSPEEAAARIMEAGEVQPFFGVEADRLMAGLVEVA